MLPNQPVSRLYRGLKFARRQRSKFARSLIAALGWTATLALTRRLNLAREMAGRIWAHSDLVQPMRRIAWYARRGRLPIPRFPKDTIFDFTDGLDPNCIQTVTELVESRNGNAQAQLSDLALLAARALTSSPLEKTKQAEFSKAANALLDQVTLPATNAANPKSGKTRLDQTDPESALRDLADAIPIADVPWFVLSGTLLGLIRENRFLPHDDDIDLGLLTEGADIAGVLDRFAGLDAFAVLKMDYQLPYPGTDFSEPRQMVLKLIHRSGVKVELFLHYQVSPTEVVLGTSVHHWVNSPFELATYELAGVPVLGPKDADKHLTENYGAWETPVTDFNPTTCTPNVRIVRHPLSVVAFLRRLQAEAANNDAGAISLAQELEQSSIIERRTDDPNRFKLAQGLFEI